MRWHWPRRPNNWLGMTESRAPASVPVMRSWDWGAGAQPVRHDVGSSIKVVTRINLNRQPSQPSSSSSGPVRSARAARCVRFNVFSVVGAEREASGRGGSYFTEQLF